MVKVDGDGNVIKQGPGDQKVGDINVAGRDVRQRNSSGSTVSTRWATVVVSVLALLTAIVVFATTDVGQQMLKKFIGGSTTATTPQMQKAPRPNK